MAQQYRLILKDGKVQIELMGCTGPICDVNAEKIREILGLSAPVRTEYKTEYGEVADRESAVITEAK